MRGHDGIDRPGTSRRASFTRTLIAVVAVLSLLLSSGAAQANGGRHHHQHRGADATFTKWATTLPADPSTAAGTLMAGVVGGDVGRGRYAGEIIGDDTVLSARLLAGARHLRIPWPQAHLHRRPPHNRRRQNAPLITATIEGVVTQGWFEGAQVTGQYRQWDTCPIPTPGNVYGTVCFQGTLHLQFGDREEDSAL